MVNAPQVSLKVIFIAHFILTTWAGMMLNFLPPSYLYMNAIILAFGMWSIISPESADAVLMFLILNVGSIVMDIIFLAIFTNYGKRAYEKDLTNSYRFCLGMAIVNLIIKPFSSFVLFRMFQDRGGQYSDFSVPNFGGAGRHQDQGYENIDQPVPSNSVDSASPSHGFDKSPLP